MRFLILFVCMQSNEGLSELTLEQEYVIILSQALDKGESDNGFFLVTYFNGYIPERQRFRQGLNTASAAIVLSLAVSVVPV